MANRFRMPEEKTDGPSKFTIELSFSWVVAVSLVAVLGLAMAFIVGLMLGRGQKPENAVPELARIMPAQVEPPKPADAPTVLKPEELQFMENLQGKGKSGEAAVVVDSTKGASDSTLSKYAAPESGDKGKLGPQAKPAEGPPPKTVPDKAAAPAKPPASKRYDTIYQLGAYANKDQAKAETDSLAKRGFKVAVSETKSGANTLYKVTIQLRGNEEEIKAWLGKIGAKNAILRDKKPL
ncbi:MAG: SPOR domain-containing protein [Desulfovibrionaceae bacterium]|nr:SPOR domain-containing protein [Desulfovibrionaceae bacterium]MBF0514710.1 SPOR domain-containing protein [Desulfovibrionaceae bacterium]